MTVKTTTLLPNWDLPSTNNFVQLVHNYILRMRVHFRLKKKKKKVYFSFVKYGNEPIVQTRLIGESLWYHPSLFCYAVYIRKDLIVVARILVVLKLGDRPS